MLLMASRQKLLLILQYLSLKVPVLQYLVNQYQQPCPRQCLVPILDITLPFALLSWLLKLLALLLAIQ